MDMPVTLAPNYRVRGRQEPEAVVTAQTPRFYGINSTWRDVPDAFASPEWIRYCEWLARQRPRTHRIRTLYRRLLRGGDVPNYLEMPWRLMRGQALNVIDIGGGFGDNYALMPASDIESVNWRVVDNERSIDLGRSIYADNPRLSFATDLAGRHDLALLVGTLQYVQDWPGFLGKIAELGQPRIYIARSPFRRRGASFLTTQTICPPNGPTAGQRAGEANVTVIGRGDLRRAMAAIGYQLETERYCKDKSPDFSHLPATHRDVAYFHSLWRPA